ncbi:MAG: Chemotaxis regulator [Nitrospirae bacterium]|jgi:two-component system, chemotaxis family, chemotaxis protein CheY|nr:Chemotaxis regulator [Nitrospirota bacterium]
MPFNLSDKSILVAEDSTIMRMFLVMNMRRMLRVNITEVENGREALAKLMNGKFDMLLTDMNMPEMGGAELVRFVRNGLKSDIPIVIITTMGESKDRDLGMRLGANAYLTKPVDVKELIKTILNHLGGYKL